MPPADFATNHAAERDSGGLGAGIKESLPTFPRHDMHVLAINEQNSLMRGRERHWLFPDDVVFLVIRRVAHSILLLRQRMEHLQSPSALLRSLGSQQ